MIKPVKAWSRADKDGNISDDIWFFEPLGFSAIPVFVLPLGSWTREIPKEAGLYFIFDERVSGSVDARYFTGSEKSVEYFRGVLDRGGFIYSVPAWEPAPPQEEEK